MADSSGIAPQTPKRRKLQPLSKRCPTLVEITAQDWRKAEDLHPKDDWLRLVLFSRQPMHLGMFTFH